MQFVYPKQIFAMKGVCKHIKAECDKSSLWKGILKAQHPAFPLLETNNYESAVRELLQTDIQGPQIEDFDFVITIYDDNFSIYPDFPEGKIGTEKCQLQAHGRMQIQEEDLKAHLLRILKREVQPGNLKMQCYVILRYQGKKQFRTRNFKFNNSDWEAGVEYLEFFSVGESFFDVRFYNENGCVSVSVSVWQDQFDDEDIYPNEVGFLKHFKNHFSFYF